MAKTVYITNAGNTSVDVVNEPPEIRQVLLSLDGIRCFCCTYTIENGGRWVKCEKPATQILLYHSSEYFDAYDPYCDDCYKRVRQLTSREWTRIKK